MEHFGKPVQVCRYQLHEIFGSAAFIPVRRITSKYLHVPPKIRGLDVTIVQPRDSLQYLKVTLTKNDNNF